MTIRLQSVSKLYGNQAAVDDVSFEAKQGEIIGLLGPNGAGKSTTMKMICGYIAPDAGKIIVNNKQVQDDSLETRKMIGYLAEQNPMYQDMYVREFLRFNSQVHKLKNAKLRIEEVIDMTGLAKEQNKFIRQLSKGYKQRVGIAQAILHDPDILILDEPISGLDPNQLVEIRSLIKQLGQKKTIIFSSHILQEVEQVCDRLLVLNNGTLVLNGTVEDYNREQDGMSIVIVEFESDLNLDSILNANESSVAGSKSSYRIQTNKPDQLKQKLFDAAVAHSTRIKTLTEETSSMQDVFQSLTKQDL